ncbi:hypothetical protein PoB_000807900 [Plakobranchus ocellatus]|uniref:Uncharacterized protein n=1 Tax=Plakobranchus ocellatus TaxID=259542 RepID=A0AAV3YH09_9GAST|nr:hypothetical protein PoB_000807900 [Plakobranchus ocellatus]
MTGSLTLRHEISCAARLWPCREVNNEKCTGSCYFSDHGCELRTIQLHDKRSPLIPERTSSRHNKILESPLRFHSLFSPDCAVCESLVARNSKQHDESKSILGSSHTLRSPLDQNIGEGSWGVGSNSRQKEPTEIYGGFPSHRATQAAKAIMTDDAQSKFEYD